MIGENLVYCLWIGGSNNSSLKGASELLLLVANITQQSPSGLLSTSFALFCAHNFFPDQF